MTNRTEKLNMKLDLILDLSLREHIFQLALRYLVHLLDNPLVHLLEPNQKILLTLSQIQTQIHHLDSVSKMKPILELKKLMKMVLSVDLTHTLMMMELLELTITGQVVELVL
jgi:hypothetical protein